MRPLAEIRSCLAVGDDDMADATRDGPDAKGRALSLLGRMCEVARPGDGAPKILLLLARMADRSWVGGRLEARIRADADWCTMDLFVDDELEVRRFAPTLAIAAPVGELLQAVERVPGAIEPLTLQEGASRERGPTGSGEARRRGDREGRRHGHPEGGRPEPEPHATEAPRRRDPARPRCPARGRRMTREPALASRALVVRSVRIVSGG